MVSRVDLLSAYYFNIRGVYGGTCTLVVDKPIDFNISSKICFAFLTTGVHASP